MRRNAHRVAAAAPPPGHLWATCWCGWDIVAVPVALIGRETRPCERCIGWETADRRHPDYTPSSVMTKQGAEQ